MLSVLAALFTAFIFLLRTSSFRLKISAPTILEFYSHLVYLIQVMRLNKYQIDHLAFSIIRNLIKEEKIISDNKLKLVEDVANLIYEEFQKEDKLDQEVREILNKHIEKIRQENIEYQTLFRMIKTKLAKERNIVL